MDAAHAKLNNTTPYLLAKVWAAAAFGCASVTEYVWTMPMVK